MVTLQDIADNLVIDAETRGSLARFANHSCSANAKLAGPIYAAGLPRVVIECLRAIASDEEITVRYTRGRGTGSVDGKCGSAKCRMSM